MAHEVKWLIENKLLINKYIGTLEMNDFLSVSETNIKLMSETSDRVHVMVDMTKFESIHTDMSRLPIIVQSSRNFMSQPNLGSIIAFGTDNKLVKFLGSMVMQLNKNEWRVLPNYQDAIQHFIHNYPALKPELEPVLADA